MVEYDEHDPIRGKAVIQPHGDRYLIANPPAMPLTTAELDHVAELPYVREPHPSVRQHGRRARHRGGALLRHPQPGLLWSLQLLLPGLSPGPDRSPPAATRASSVKSPP